MQTTAMGKEAETKTETQAGLAVAQDGCVALAALPCRRLSAGFAPSDSGLGGDDLLFFDIISYHFWAAGKKLLDRPKPFSHVHLGRAVNPELGSGALREPRGGDSGPESGRRTQGGGRRAEEEARSEGSRKTESGDRKIPSSWYHSGIISHQGSRGWWIDRRHVRICVCGGRLHRIRGLCQVAGRTVAILGQGRAVTGEVSASNSTDGSPPPRSECVPVVLMA